MISLHRKIALAALSTALSLAVAIPVVRRQIAPPDGSTSEGGTVRVIDTSEDVARLLEERARGAQDRPDESAPRADGDPPPLHLQPLDEETAARFFGGLRDDSFPFDKDSYYVNWPFADHYIDWSEHEGGGFRYRTNDFGMREDADVRVDDPPLRILVLGDSHVAGVVRNDESFTNILEQMLGASRPPGAVDALNAAVGGYNPYNYLGTLERLAHLKPQVVLLVIYGGNDFFGLLSLQRYFERRGPMKPYKAFLESFEESGELSVSIRAQEMTQVAYMLANPEDVEIATDTTNSILWHMARRCEELSAELVVAYLPPPLAVQSRYYGKEIAGSRPVTEAELEAIHVSDRMADGVLAFLDRKAIGHHDLRPAFRAADEPLYWLGDWHTNVEGHRLIAEELLPLLQGAGSSIPLTATPRDMAPEVAEPTLSIPIPAEASSAWRVSSGDVTFSGFAGTPALWFHGQSLPASVSLPVDTPLTGVDRVQLGVTTDGAFEVRVTLGDRASVTVSGSNTQRQERFLEFPLTKAAEEHASESDTPRMTIEILRCTSPVIVRTIRVK